MSDTQLLDDPRVSQLMLMGGEYFEELWPVRVVKFATYLVYFCMYYGTKSTYQSSIHAFNTIFALLNIPSPFKRVKIYPREQIDIFMALVTLTSHKAAPTCYVA